MTLWPHQSLCAFLTLRRGGALNSSKIKQKKQYIKGKYKIKRDHNGLSTSMIRLDDGPKLREEKEFQDFYSDLGKDTFIPLLLPTSSNAKNAQSSEINGDDASDQNQVHMKQLMYNGAVTLEPISLHYTRNKFKKCGIAVDQLDTTSRISSLNKRGKRSKAYYNEFHELSSPYYTKFHGGEGYDGGDVPSQDAFREVSKNLKDFKTEYDMDEQDELYLKHLNIEYCESRMTHEIFEILISVLENEWNHLEKQIPPRSTPTSVSISDHQSQTANIHYELYGSDDGTGQSTDQACAVCGGGESDNSNAIVFCDGCDVAVHQECYGIVFIPEGQWLCRRCLVSKNRKVNCLFCPSHTGAFKQTDTGSWAHVICGLWIPELYFANLHYMEPIEGADSISKSRWKLVCNICKQRMGACIQCAHKNCFTAYHVTCAKRAGLYMDFGGASIGEAASNQLHPPHMPKCFCDRHAPFDWASSTEGILRTRRYFAKCNENSMSKNLNGSRSGTSSTLLSKNKWKTNRGTPIAPHIFAEITQRVLNVFKISNSKQVSYGICKYWSMKRELKRGAPLVRKFDPSSYNTLNEQQLQERVSVTDVLLKDLFRLRELSSLVKRRTTASNAYHASERKIQTLTKYPERLLIKRVVVTKFISSEPFKNLQTLVTDEKLSAVFEKCQTYNLETVASFKEDIYQFFTILETSGTSTRAVLNNVRRAKSLLDRLYESIANMNVSKHLHEAFIIDDGNTAVIEQRKWKGTYLQHEEGLSDVDELDAKEKRQLKKMLIHKK